MFARKALIALCFWPLRSHALARSWRPRSSADPFAAPSLTAPAPSCRVSPSPSTNLETKVVQTAVTDGEGRHQVLYLNPGMYSIEAELSGFKKYMLKETRVGVGDAGKIDVVLQTGGVEETVQVVAETALLKRRAASVAPPSTRSRSRSCRSATAPPTC